MSSSTSGIEYGKFPAVITAYDPNTRECTIKNAMGDEIDAEIHYPIGDDSKVTEIRIIVGDSVWCEYIQGDTRRALITGYRNPQSGNTVGTRRIAQDIVHLDADQNVKLDAGQVIDLNAGQTINLTAGQAINLTVGGMTLQITSGDVIANGISLINHVHFVPKENQLSEKPQ